MKRCLAVCLSVCVSVCLASSAFAEILPWDLADADGYVFGTDVTDLKWFYATFKADVVSGQVSLDSNELKALGGSVDINNDPTLSEVTIKFDGSYAVDWATLKLHIDSGVVAYIKINGEPTAPDIFSNPIPPTLAATYYTVENELAKQINTVTFALNAWDGNPYTVGFAASTYETPPTTPEPASMLIFGLGLAGLGIARLRRKTV